MLIFANKLDFMRWKVNPNLHFPINCPITYPTSLMYINFGNNHLYPSICGNKDGCMRKSIASKITTLIF